MKELRKRFMELIRSAEYYKILAKNKVLITIKNAKNEIEVLHIRFGENNYSHLFGIDKLNDRANLRTQKEKSLILNKILENEQTRQYIKNSNFYESTKRRLFYFNQIFWLLNNAQLYTWENPKYSSIKADFVFVYQYADKQNKKNFFYLHFFIVKDNHKDCFYPVSFFCDEKNKATSEKQKKLNINSVNFSPHHC